MPNMNPFIIVIANPTKVVGVWRDDGKHAIKGNIEEEKFDEETQHDDIVEKTSLLSQPHFGLSVRVKPTLPKVGTWSPPWLPKTQSSSWRAKTPRIGMFLVSFARSWSVDI
jgi:hypothetical protein